MSKSNEEKIEELYYEVGQMLFAGMGEEQIFKILYDGDLVEKVARFIINEAKNNFVKVANSIQNKTDNIELLNKTIEDINNNKNDNQYPIIDVRELEKYSTKEEILKNINIGCIVFYDSERVLTDLIVGENKDIYNRKYAWKRTYDIEGYNAEHKAATMQDLIKQEYDGYDYIWINMTNDKGDMFGKQVLPNGETFITGFSKDGKMLDSFAGHVNDLGIDTNN